jgi:lauroyl/myristoyl acyltransferase
MAQGQGALLVTAHYGCWDLAWACWTIVIPAALHAASSRSAHPN